MSESADDEFPRRGEIWFVETPGQPYDPHQPRPALIISEGIRNRLSDDFIVVPIVSSGRLGPTHVPIVAGQGGLPKDSVLFCEEITTLHRDFLIDGPLGRTVPPGLLGQVVRSIRRAIGEVVAEPS